MSSPPRNDHDLLFSMFDSTELERDIALIDRLKDKFGCKSDKEVALMLKMDHTVLSAVRRSARQVEKEGKPGAKARTLTPVQRLRGFDRLGYAWARQTLFVIFPDEVAHELVQKDNERTLAAMEAEMAVHPAKVTGGRGKPAG